MAAAALAVLGLPLAATPAYAAPSLFSVSSISSFTLGAGGTKTFTVTVTNGHSPNSEDGGAPMTAKLVVAKSGQGQSADFEVDANQTATGCQASSQDGSCSFSFPGSGPGTADGAEAALSFTVKVLSNADVTPGGSAAFDGSSVTISDGTNSSSPSFTVTLNGSAPAKPAKITGTVFDITTGQTVSNALVDLNDAAGHSYTTRTGTKGQFQFIDQAPTTIAAGTIYIGATKSGYQALVGPGRVFDKIKDIPYPALRIHPVAAPVTSATTATPLPSFSSAPPSTDGSGAPSGSGSVAAIGTGGGGASASGGLGGMFQFILIGGVALIIGGIVVVAYMFFKRRRDDLGGDPLDDDPDNDDGGGGHGMPAYDRPPPPRRMPEPTMVRPRVAEAPTMMHARAGGYPPPGPRAPVEPYQDYSPAGYQQPRGPGYDPNFPASGPGPGGAYGSPPRSPYPEQGYGQPYGQGQPAYPPPAGYGQPGSPGAGYPPDAGYGSSGGYGGQGGSYGSSGGYGGGQGSSGGYGGQGGSYGSSGGYGGGQGGSPGGYDQYQTQQGGYDQRGYADQGYDNQQGGYDQGYETQQGYGGGQHSRGGYDQRGGYDAGGYDPSGYDQNGYDSSGYDSNGYDQNGYNADGYHVNGYTQYPGEYDARAGDQPSSPSGYRGGYVPPEQRGSVDWLDD